MRLTLVERTERKLIRKALSARPGEFLGSEAELLEEFEVSRPTLRQAAKIVASDQIVEVRRGANGGFFASRPNLRHMTRAPAFFLRMQGATLEHSILASAAVIPAMVREAAKAVTKNDAADLKKIIDRIESTVDDEWDVEMLIDYDQSIVRLVSRLADNPVLGFFLEVSYAFGRMEEAEMFFQRDPSRQIIWRSWMTDFARAIMNKDGEMAELFSRRRSRQILEWIEQDRQPRSEEAVPLANS
jgi:DNA-binding FadR family transcriptional regulator